ncbi:chemotaxis protein CheW [Alicyclobacillus herbarius]|uniref:chemotaxis protein CheW n=1 Tax=Alicyclobacillus herbarius TaxID=122960 RepID=UPI0003FDD33F|nr:chemotaxis protein CheW [Alicyclobacillus herbarius]
MQYIVCRPFGQAYAIPMQAVRSVERVGSFTRVPGTKPCCKGLMNLRGEVIPVIDLAMLLKLGETPTGPQTRIIVLERAEITVGLLAEHVREVLEIPQSNLEVHEARAHQEAVRAIADVQREPVAVLDLEYLLNPEHALGA